MYNMKKILLLIPIFLLVSCNNPNDTKTSTTNSETKEEVSTNNDPKTTTNIPDSTEITWETTIHW